MKWFLVLLFSVVASAADPKGCCFPKQWEANVVENLANHNVATGKYDQHRLVYKFFYDDKNEFLAVTRFGDGVNTNSTHTIFNYNTGYQYVMNLDDKSCTRSELTFPHVQCFDEEVNATFHGTSYFGPDTHPILVNSFSFQAYNFTVSALVTPDECYPMSMTIRGSLDGPQTFAYMFTSNEADNVIRVYGMSRASPISMETVDFTSERNYINIKAGINDTSVFTVPAVCEPPPPVCCLPAQWSATLSALGDSFNTDSRTDVQEHETGKIYSDAARQVVVRDTHDDRNARAHTKVIQDYSTGLEYTIKNGICRTAPLVAPFVYCIPASANFTGSAHLGDTRNPLLIDVFEYFDNGHPVTITVTRDGCYPVTQATRGTFGRVTKEEVFWFEDFKPFVDEDSVFAIPVFCTSTG